MPTRTTPRGALPRLGCIVCVASLLLAAAAAAQPASPAPPGRPAPPPVVRVNPAPPAASGAADSVAHPDFSGVWVLNARESDDPLPIFAAMMPTNAPADGKERRPGGRGGVGLRGGDMGGGLDGSGGRSRGTGPGNGGMGGAGRGDDVTNGGDDAETGTRERPSAEARFGGGNGNDPAAAQARQTFAAHMTAAWRRLLIAQSGDELEIIDGSEQRRVHVLDGQRRDRRSTRAGTLEIAAWDGDAIVITLEQKDRPGMTQTYRLVPAEKRLYVTLRLPARGQGDEKVIRLVYESA